jgi:hypothetical protein
MRKNVIERLKSWLMRVKNKEDQKNLFLSDGR